MARDGMGHASVETTSRSTEIPEQMPGAFIPLLSADESIQLGLVSTPEGGRKMARAFLQMGEGDELSNADLADALGEATNILAGFVKRNMQPHLARVQLGLPLYVNGHLEMTERVRALVTHLKMGDIPLAVIVLRSAAYQPNSA
ncbi:MAG: chemotaxis protein CheX [Myxococcota bacterium]